MLHLTLLLSLFVFSSLANQDFEGAQYQSQPRSEKTKDLWAAITENPENLGWYSALQTAEMFVESMKTSFTTPADDFPQQYIGNFFERKKLIHTVGVIAKANFTITNNPKNYTGLFHSGSDSCFIRLSLAKKPLTEMGEGAFAPGIAMKFLRDGVPSGNIFAMFALLGQENFNFFSHDLTNHVPSPSPEIMSLPEKLLLKKFKTASSWPTMLGLSSMARFDQEGRPNPQPNFPYRLVFHPNLKYHTTFPERPTGTPFYKQLIDGLDIGHIYDVYAQDKPLQGNDELFKIGEVVLTTKATTSHFGDRHFFHQHSLFEDDLQLKPEWQSGAAQDLKNQESVNEKPGFQYPDLPWN